MEENQEEFEEEFETDEFFFESDHLALRGNTDYSNILRTIAILQSQKVQATKNLDLIIAAEKQALENPEEFLEKLTNNVSIDLPGPINVIEVPKINFTKYNVSIPDYPSCNPIILPATNNDLTVRGRVFDQSKPETFNQLWSNTEQRRLEELLIEYPPEAIEMRRFAKIARALGNRTTKQVASRLQKYFKKLHSAGFPVPGRLPKRSRHIYSYNHMKYSKQACRPTTFFPARDVPVIMCEEEDDTLGNPLDPSFFRKYSTPYSSGDKNSMEDTNRIDVVISQDLEPDNPQEMIELKMLRLLKRIKSDKEINDRPFSEHEGYKCDFCLEEPLIGTRWHCSTCTDSVDFCADCMITQIMNTSQSHPLDHKFVGIRCVNSDEHSNQHTSRQQSDYFGSDENEDEDEKPDSSGNCHDKDYLSHKFSKDYKEYNYLDPNFLPE